MNIPDFTTRANLLATAVPKVERALGQLYDMPLTERMERNARPDGTRHDTTGNTWVMLPDADAPVPNEVVRTYAATALQLTNEARSILSEMPDIPDTRPDGGFRSSVLRRMDEAVANLSGATSTAKAGGTVRAADLIAARDAISLLWHETRYTMNHDRREAERWNAPAR